MSGEYNTTVNGVDVYVGSGNVYEDVGLDDADELFAKAQLAHQINTIIRNAAGRGPRQQQHLVSANQTSRCWREAGCPTSHSTVYSSS